MSSFPTTVGYVRFSLQEKGRRFAAVRERMRAKGLKAIVVQSNSTKWDCGSAEARYLTFIGGNGEEGYLIFDLNNDPTYFTTAGGHIPNWLSIQDWTTDIRPCAPSAAQAIGTRIKELSLEREAVGLVGRSQGPLTPDGRWSSKAFESLQQELPSATFIDFDQELAAVRAVKSQEEIACHERAMALTEEAVGVMRETARVGVPACQVFGRMVGAMVAGGADMSVMVQLNAAHAPRLAARLVTHRALERGDVILNEITAKYAGYWSQVHAPVSVGTPPGKNHQRLFDLVHAGLRRGEEIMKPGLTVADLAQAIRAPADDAGRGWSDIPTVKGIGLATSEFPVSPPAGSGPSPYGSQGMQATLQENMVICLQPSAWDPDERIGMHIADTFVVTGGGCRRLGRRDVEFHAT